MVIELGFKMKVGLPKNRRQLHQQQAFEGSLHNPFGHLNKIKPASKHATESETGIPRLPNVTQYASKNANVTQCVALFHLHMELFG